MKIHPIEKNVSGSRRYEKYPFKDLKVGDGFRIDGDSSEERKIRGAASMHTLRTGNKISVAKIDGGYQIRRES